MKRFKLFLNADPIIRFSFLVSLIIALLTFFFLIVQFNRLPPELPLFYSRPWGDEQLGKPSHLFVLPGGAFFILLINSYLGFLFSEQELLLSKILLISSVIVSIISFIALFKIIMLVT